LDLMSLLVHPLLRQLLAQLLHMSFPEPLVLLAVLKLQPVLLQLQLLVT
jgi:hypothetical protein